MQNRSSGFSGYIQLHNFHNFRSMKFPYILSCFSIPLIIISIAQIGAQFDVPLHLGTKSPYSFESNSDTVTKYSHLSELSNPIQPPPPWCQPDPIHINLLARHGAREPSGSDGRELIDLQNKLHQYGKCIGNSEYSWLTVKFFVITLLLNNVTDLGISIY